MLKSLVRNSLHQTLVTDSYTIPTSSVVLKQQQLTIKMGFVNVRIDVSIEELQNHIEQLKGVRNIKNIVSACIDVGFNQTIDETLEDPYDSIWLQLSAIFVYLLIILSSCLMMAFTYYEQLYHGQYRTVINQLITNLYNLVCIVFPKK